MYTLAEVYEELKQPWAHRTLMRRRAFKDEAKAQMKITRADLTMLKGRRAVLLARRDIETARRAADEADRLWARAVRALLSAQGRLEFLSGDCCMVHYGQHSGTVIFGKPPEGNLSPRVSEALIRLKAQDTYIQGAKKAKEQAAALNAKRRVVEAAREELTEELLVFQELTEAVRAATKAGASKRTKYDLRLKQSASRARVKTRQRRLDKALLLLQNV